MFRLPGLRLPQIPAGNFDIPDDGQLPLPEFALDHQLEAGALQVIDLKTAGRRDGAVDKAPEHLPRRDTPMHLNSLTPMQISGTPRSFLNFR